VPQRFILRDLLAHWFKRTASSLFWEFRNPSHLISWQCIARCPRVISQPVPNSRSNGRAASTMRYRPPTTSAAHHEVRLFVGEFVETGKNR
jgi:hypothetical protein